MKLYFNTVNESLKSALLKLMEAEIFNDFRLVGGTALSLQNGHRVSVDIDLFSDKEYGQLDFKEIEKYLISNFEYVDSLKFEPAMGKSFFIGKSQDDAIKLDVYYTDKFVFDTVIVEGIRMASEAEILAMKVDIIQRIGRKKDFWDLHELSVKYSIVDMLEFHKMRYPYSHDQKLILNNFVNFKSADDDLEPICLKGKYWEFIKEDFIELINDYNLDNK